MHDEEEEIFTLDTLLSKFVMLFSITFVESIVDDLDIPILDILDSLLIIFDVEIANSDADGLFVFSASFVEITIFDVESLIPGKELLIVDVIYSVFFGFVVGSFFFFL